MHLIFSLYVSSFGDSWCLSRVDVYIYTKKATRAPWPCNIKSMLCPRQVYQRSKLSQNPYCAADIFLAKPTKLLNKNDQLCPSMSTVPFFTSFTLQAAVISLIHFCYNIIRIFPATTQSSLDIFFSFCNKN